jgi:CRP/FNR family transcriptional regulator, cyclic AMP receptor protein
VNRSDIFKELDESQIELLRPLFEAFSCQAGTIIFQQGEPAEFLYLVINGKVEISFKPYDGMPMTVSRVGSGGVFGWSAVLGSEQYTSTAIAFKALKSFRVHGNELRRFCLEHPAEGKRILEHLAEGVSSRWTDAHKQVKAFLIQGLTEKSK